MVSLVKHFNHFIVHTVFVFQCEAFAGIGIEQDIACGTAVAIHNAVLAGCCKPFSVPVREQGKSICRLSGITQRMIILHLLGNLQHVIHILNFRAAQFIIIVPSGIKSVFRRIVSHLGAVRRFCFRGCVRRECIDSVPCPKIIGKGFCSGLKPFQRLAVTRQLRNVHYEPGIHAILHLFRTQMNDIPQFSCRSPCLVYRVS